MATDTIDPVAAPNAYRELILGMLGDRDPLAVQEAMPGELRRLVADAGDDLRTRPAAGEWSVLELVGHAIDAELVLSTRYRFILAEDTPPIQPYDQDHWATRMRHNDADPEDLLAPFEALRRSNLALWRATPAEDRARYGIHAERGPESYELTFRLTAGHDLFHLDQARQTLAAVRAR
jgi:hypothetical protein